MNRALLFFSFLVNFFLLNLFLSLFLFGISLLLRRTHLFYSPRSRSSLYLYALALPPLLSYVTLVASLTPPFLTVEDHLFGAHVHLGHPYHHLCLFDSSIGLPPSLPFRTLLIASLLLIFFSSVKGLYSGWKTRGYLSWLRSKRAVPRNDGLGRRLHWLSSDLPIGAPLKLQLVHSRFPVSLLAGVFRPQLILSTGLLEMLSPPQLRALLQHEMAHSLRRDNLCQFFLSFCKNLLFICPTGHLLFRWWREETELFCDEVAIYSTGRPLDLAEALLEMQRQMRAAQASRLQPLVQSAFFPPASASFMERRINKILSFCEGSTIPSCSPLVRSNSLVGLAASALFSFFFLYLLDICIHPLFLHCQLERIIRFLV